MNTKRPTKRPAVAMGTVPPVSPANWRIVFRFDESNVRDVDLVDYH